MTTIIAVVGWLLAALFFVLWWRVTDFLHYALARWGATEALLNEVRAKCPGS